MDIKVNANDQIECKIKDGWSVYVHFNKIDVSHIKRGEYFSLDIELSKHPTISIYCHDDTKDDEEDISSGIMDLSKFIKNLTKEQMM